MTGETQSQRCRYFTLLLWKSTVQCSQTQPSDLGPGQGRCWGSRRTVTRVGDPEGVVERGAKINRDPIYEVLTETVPFPGLPYLGRMRDGEGYSGKDTSDAGSRVVLGKDGQEGNGEVMVSFVRGFSTLLES